MKCENELCVYQNEGDCLLNSIELDINGSCNSCIIAEIPKEELKKLKAKTLKNIEKSF